MRSRRRGTPGGGRSATMAARTSGSAMRAARSATGRWASASYVGRPRNACDVRNPQNRPCPCELTCGTMRAPSAFSRSMRSSFWRHGPPREPPNGNVTTRPVSRDTASRASRPPRPTARCDSPAAPGRMVVNTASPDDMRTARTRAQISLCAGERAGYLAAVDRLVQLEPVHRETHRAGADAFGDQLGHADDVVVGGGLVGRAPLAHHEGAHRAVRHLGGDVERARDPVERVEVLADGLPVPPDRLAQGCAGDALDALHQADEPVVTVGRGGREADAAVTHDHGGDAVPDRRGEQRVPGDLPVVVGVDVDEAGRDREAGGVELLTTGLVDGAHRGDAAVVEGDVARRRTYHPGRRSRFRSGSPDRARQPPDVVPTLLPALSAPPPTCRGGVAWPGSTEMWGRGPADDLRPFIRDIPDFPRPGVTFRDITPLLGDAGAFRAATELLVAPFDGTSPRSSGSRRAGSSSRRRSRSRSVPASSPCASRASCRGTRTRTATSSSTGATRSRCTATRSEPDDRVLIVDDVLATGGTATATSILVSEFFTATVIGLTFLLELPALGGRDRLQPLGHRVESILSL